MAAAPRSPRGPPGVGRDYYELTKPRIMLLIVVTTVGGDGVGRGRLPPLGLTVATVFGMCLRLAAAGRAEPLVDRDIDRADGAHPPPAGGRRADPPAPALVFGLALNVIAAVPSCGPQVNCLTAVLAIGGSAFYVLVYTIC